MRGEEVVSLGWCFWHWGCFGCLLCGVKLNVEDNYEEEKNTIGGLKDLEDERWKRKRTKLVGVELDQVPLCSVCKAETTGEDTVSVLKRGLETVSRFDCGLSRDRIKMLSESRAAGDSRSRKNVLGEFRPSSELKKELTRFINGSGSGVSSSHPALYVKANRTSVVKTHPMILKSIVLWSKMLPRWVSVKMVRQIQIPFPATARKRPSENRKETHQLRFTYHL